MVLELKMIKELIMKKLLRVIHFGANWTLAPEPQLRPK